MHTQVIFQMSFSWTYYYMYTFVYVCVLLDLCNLLDPSAYKSLYIYNINVKNVFLIFTNYFIKLLPIY